MSATTTNQIEELIAERSVVDAKAAKRRAFQQNAAAIYPNGKKIMIRHDPFNRARDRYLS